jgi:hypothetical protein
MTRAQGEPTRRLSQLAEPPEALTALEPSVFVPASEPSVFVPAPEVPAVPSRRGRYWAVAALAAVIVVVTGILVAWPHVSPRRLDPVERVAEDYLNALAREKPELARQFATVDEPPAIRAVQGVRRDRGGDRAVRGSFASLGELHSRIEAEYDYDAGAARFTPKNPLGAAAETMDALHAAKEDAEKSGLYKKMQSGDPNDIFDAAEQLGKVFTQLAEGALAPKRILPSYKMLVESSRPPLSDDANELALEVAGSKKDWDALLNRPFHSLKADGPFIYERAEIVATVTDRLASSGDAPTRLRLTLVRFRLEGIDTGWKVVAAKRIVPGVKDDGLDQAPTPRLSPRSGVGSPTPSPPPPSLNDPGTR